jgi:hypothetical protein
MADLDAHRVQPGDALCPLSFDRGLPFKLEAELAKELNRRNEVVDDNAHVVHAFEGHVPTLHRDDRSQRVGKAAPTTKQEKPI